MAIEFECPECETTIRVKDSAAGKTGRCPKCRVLLMVPDPEEWDDEEDEEAATGREGEDEREPDIEHEPPAFVPPMVEPPAVESGPTQAGSESFPPMVEPPEPAPVAREDDPDTMISQSPRVLAGEEETTRPGPSPTELHASEVPNFLSDAPAPAANDFSSSDPRLVAVRRARSRPRRGMPAKTIITIATAVGGIFLILGVGWWLYASSGPDLTGPITGQRLGRLTLAEISAPLPTDDVSQETIDLVLGDISAQSFSIDSPYVLVDLYDGGDELDISIAPGNSAVPVRVQLAEDADIRAALADVEKEIARAKQQELASATADMFEDRAAYIEDGTRMERLLEYRDEVALNAAVGSVGYAVEAIVQSTPFPCVYEDSEGYCYFFVPEGTKKFRLRGRKVLGENKNTPLPVDFEVTLTEAEESVRASRTPSEEDAPADEEDSEQEEEKAEESEEDKEPSEDEPNAESADGEEKPAEEMEESTE